MQTLLQDLRYGARVLWKSPGFTAVAVITLALGIGATASIFTVVHGVLLRPLPYAEPERIVLGTSEKQGEQWATTPPDYYILREQQQTMEALAGLYFRSRNLTGTGEPERLLTIIASADLWPALGVTPVLGRGFTRGEEQWGGHRVVVLSHGFWQRRFAGDPGILGKTIRLNDADYTVIGVMGAGTKLLYPDVQLAIPMAFAPGDNYNTRNNYFLSFVGRLKPGVNVAQADADLDVIHERIAQQFPESGDTLGAQLQPLRDALVSNVRDGLLMLMGAVGLLLLIGCSNIANLLMARASGRTKELGVRAALGATGGRLVRQLLTESGLLALMGGTLGIMLAYWAVEAVALLPERTLPRAEEVALDWNVVLFTFVMMFVTAVLFGIAPALQGARANVNDALREGGRGGITTGHPRLRSALVITEVALAMVLLVSAGLVGSSLVRLLNVDAGFDPQNVLSAQISIAASKYVDDVPVQQFTPLNLQRATHFFTELTKRVRLLPQVESVGATTQLPLTQGDWGKRINFFDRPEPRSLDEVPDIRYRLVLGDYFRAVGMTLLNGRWLDERDVHGRPVVAVVNETLANRFWPGQDAVGKSFELVAPTSLIPRTPSAFPPPRYTIVGIAKDAKEGGVNAPVEPAVYASYPQSSEGAATMFLTVRTSGDPMAVVGDLRQILEQLDSDVPLANLMSMQDRLRDSIANPRLQSILLGVFSALALLLAAVGIYGLMSYSVAQRRHEIGIRMALGAQPAQVLRLVLGSGVRLSLIGLALGIAGGVVAGRLISSLLFQVRPTDAITFAAVTAVLGAVALLATYIPARRATTVDPVVALRYE